MPRLRKAHLHRLHGRYAAGIEALWNMEAESRGSLGIVWLAVVSRHNHPLPIGKLAYMGRYIDAFYDALAELAAHLADSLKFE